MGNHLVLRVILSTLVAGKWLATMERTPRQKRLL